ncbi:MAG: hypothetical protein DDT19_01893 [Syntrophomonadaceae bacterium]|nr:hypothetical protein [Bacillota bacterium]
MKTFVISESWAVPILSILILVQSAELASREILRGKNTLLSDCLSTGMGLITGLTKTVSNATLNLTRAELKIRPDGNIPFAPSESRVKYAVVNLVVMPKVASCVSVENLEFGDISAVM